MRSTLTFPDGVRLAHLEELPGSPPERAAAWARIQSAKIAPGFTLRASSDTRFTFYAEANADAPCIWAVFSDLCLGLLGREATLIFGEIDDEPMLIGTARTRAILGLLARHHYQLAHDGLLQFGLMSQDAERITEVFVAPTKHLTIWFSDETCLRSVLRNHALPEVGKLEFIADYPRATMQLSDERVSFRDHGEMIEHLKKQIGALP